MTEILKGWFTETLTAALGWTVILIPIWLMVPNSIALIYVIQVISYLAFLNGLCQTKVKKITKTKEEKQFQQWRKDQLI